MRQYLFECHALLVYQGLETIIISVFYLWYYGLFRVLTLLFPVGNRPLDLDREDDPRPRQEDLGSFDSLLLSSLSGVIVGDSKAKSWLSGDMEKSGVVDRTLTGVAGPELLDALCARAWERTWIIAILQRRERVSAEPLCKPDQ
jgi:hypothetical protein